MNGSTSGAETTAVLAGPRGAAAEDAPLAPGDTIGRYAVLEQIGSGGMGRVYRAFDTRLRRMVAIKLLRRQTKPEAEARMIREAQAMAQLSHPNVLPVYDVDTADGRVYMAMEFIEGSTLSAWRERENPHWRDVVRLHLQAGRGLAAAHAAGLVHRDFKPSNVLVGNDGRVRVLDFGLVRSVGGADDGPSLTTAEPEHLGDLGSHPDLTGMDTVMGTPPYMSPEQHFGHRIDARGDQFSFCVSLFESLYGQRPFRATSYAKLVHAKSTGELEEPPVGAVPRRVHAVLLRGLRPQPNDRYPSMDALLADLSRQVRPPQLGWAFGAGITGLVAWAAVANGPADPDAACRSASQDTPSPWSDTIRRGVHGALVKAGGPAPDATFERVDARLTTWVQRWRDARYQACAATRVSGEQSDAMFDLRMQCLHRRAVELRALGESWAEGLDRDGVAEATRAAADLPRLEPCGDLEALGRSTPPPEDPEDASQVEALRDALAQASGKARGGRPKQAMRELYAVQAEATALDYRPLTAEVELALGSTQEDLGERDEAIGRWTAAHYHAIASGADGVAAETATLLSYGYGDALADPEQAEVWARHARAWVVQLDSPEHEARLLESLGTLRMAQSRYAESLELFERAFELRTADASPNDLLSVNYARLHVGIAQMRLGRYTEAIAALDATLRSQLDVLGPEHIDVSSTRTNLANAQERAGDLEGAEANLRSALAGFESTLGEHHPNIAIVLTNLGNVLTSRGAHEAAQPVFERALAVSKGAFDASHPVVASAYNNLGENLHARGQLDQAREAHEAGLVLRVERLGDDHPHVAASLANLAELDIDREDWPAARDRLVRALEILGDAQIDPAEVARTELLLAEVLWRGGLDPARARSLAESSRARFVGLESGDIGVEACDRLLSKMRPRRPSTAHAR